MFLFYFLALILIFFSYKSLRGGIYYLNFFKHELNKPKSNFTPFASIIAPCRGRDEDLEKNLSALFQQNYPNFEIIFVTDSKDDESLEIIEEVSRVGAKLAKSDLIIAGKSQNEAQKIHNLREAVLHVSAESEVLVFVDSDARPAKDWLRNLVAPLKDEKIGCSTGYRWFISKKFSFASEMRSVWNASIASALGANQENNFCWGGSMAIRRETFEKLEIREKWKGVLSDDFVMTRTMKAANLPIYFVPKALTASIENCNFRELLEFTTRQMKITRVYAQKLWIMSFIGSGLFNLVMLSSILLICFGVAFFIPILTILLVSIFSIGKSWLRLNAVKLILKDHKQELNRQFWTQNTLWILTPLLFFYNCICALISRKISWRGITYKLNSPDSTEIIANISNNK